MTLELRPGYAIIGVDPDDEAFEHEHFAVDQADRARIAMDMELRSCRPHRHPEDRVFMVYVPAPVGPSDGEVIPKRRPRGTTPDPDRVVQQFRRIRDEISGLRVPSESERLPDGRSAVSVYYDRLGDLYGEAFQAISTLDNHLSAGGPLPSSWLSDFVEPGTRPPAKTML